MLAKELIGKKAIRTKPAECRYGQDGSYTNGRGLLIKNVTDTHVYAETACGQTTALDLGFNDDNWALWEGEPDASGTADAGGADGALR